MFPLGGSDRLRLSQSRCRPLPGLWSRRIFAGPMPDPPGAHGTAGSLLPRARVYDRFPDVPFRAAPPGRFAAPRRHHLRRQGPVQGLIPLGGDLGADRCQVVESRQHPPPGAVWAAAQPRRPGCNGSFPRVPLLTAPPDRAVAERRYVGGPQAPVFFRVPLGGNARGQRGKVVFSRRNRPAGTDGTAGCASWRADTSTAVRRSPFGC